MFFRIKSRSEPMVQPRGGERETVGAIAGTRVPYHGLSKNPETDLATALSPFAS